MTTIFALGTALRLRVAITALLPQVLSMKSIIPLAIFWTSLTIGGSLSLAQETLPAVKSAASGAQVVLPAGLTEDMLAPPPVPRFMLEKPGKPLTPDEMATQIREAQTRAGVQRNTAEQSPPQVAVPAIGTASAAATSSIN